MPSEAIPNYFYHNNGNLTFTNQAVTWGLEAPTFSNGSAYGDLDNDGDLDLVVNNINMPSIIYENRTSQSLEERGHLTLKLQGSGQNTKAIGSKVFLFSGDQILYQELNPMRGFESTVDYKLVFGLGTITDLDSIHVIWPGNNITRLYGTTANQVLTLKEEEAEPWIPVKPKSSPTLFAAYQDSTVHFAHRENAYVDFDKDRLLYHMNSTEGPCLCKGDVNNDGQDDFYVGGAHGQPGRLYVQSDQAVFYSDSTQFSTHRQNEDLDCVFFDANGDGYQDLYVTSGGSEFSSISVWLNDHLYFGDGAGNFQPSTQKLPHKGFESTSVVVPFDYDSDGDLDLFVGGRSVPFYYGVPCDSYLLENDGKGSYKVSEAAALAQLGMVTDATASDLNDDGQQELIVVGKWMPVKVFSFVNGSINDISTRWGLEDTQGWYHTVQSADLNGDGRIDLLLGNHGLNTRFHASPSEPVQLMVNDFDNNGTFEQVISMYIDGKPYPFVQLKELAGQLPAAAQRYSSFNDYKYDHTELLFPSEVVQKGSLSKAVNLASGVYFNSGNAFEFKPLPTRAQISPIYAFHVEDFNHDGTMDIFLGGNFSQSKPEVGSYRASYGALLEGDAQGSFQFVPSKKSGLKLSGDIRNFTTIDVGSKKIMVIARNNNDLLLTEINKNYE